MSETTDKIQEGTLEITIATGSGLLAKTMEHAERALVGVFKSASANVADIAVRLAIPIQLLTVTSAKIVTAYGYDAIKIIIAIRSRNAEKVAREVFTTAVGLLTGVTLSTITRIFALPIGLVLGTVVSAGVGWFASNEAGTYWDNTLSKSPMGQWSIGKIGEQLALGIKFTPNTLCPPLADAPAQFAVAATRRSRA